MFRTYKRVSTLKLPRKFVFISHFVFVFYLLRRNANSLYDHLKHYTMKNRNFDNAIHRRFHIENQEVSMWNLRCRHFSLDKKSITDKKTFPKSTIQDEIYWLKIPIHILYLQPFNSSRMDSTGKTSFKGLSATRRFR